MNATRTTTRAIGRAAIRGELARGALEQFCRRGFDGVTFDDLAATAGVSRSTFLRYFGSKEEVVLSSFDPLGESMVGALHARPAGEDDWRALRRARGSGERRPGREPAEGLELLRLVGRTPALCARLREKQAAWRPLLVHALTERPSTRPPSSVVLHARVAAAMECLMAALEHWVAGEGRPSLDDLVDEAFGALAPTRR